MIFDNRISKKGPCMHPVPLITGSRANKSTEDRQVGTDACGSVFPSHNRKINGMRDRGLNKALDRRKLPSEIHISFRRRAGAKRNFLIVTRLLRFFSYVLSYICKKMSLFS